MIISPVKALLFMKGHSERVPNKNMRLFCERPLFHWIMNSLIQSKYVKEIIINTDSDKIAEEAKKNFDVTIHMRPDYLLNIQCDEANQIMAYDLTQTDGEYFLQSHSTNPLLRSETIDQAIETFFDQRIKYDSLFSVTATQNRYYWPDGTPINHEPLKLIKTQELPIIYQENSNIYIFSRSTFNKHKNRIGSKPLLFPIDRIEAIDIDYEHDFTIAEMLMKRYKRGKNSI